jgi:hypothetical protein
MVVLLIKVASMTQGPAQGLFFGNDNTIGQHVVEIFTRMSARALAQKKRAISVRTLETPA